MANTVQCSIVSAEGEIFSGSVEMVIAAGDQGDLGIVPGHTALLTKLLPGPIRLVLEGGEEQIFFVSGGLLEVQPKMVSVLADTALRADDLDEAAAAEAKSQAEKHLSDQHGEMNYAMAATQLSEAAGRLRTIEQLRKKAKSAH